MHKTVSLRVPCETIICFKVEKSVFLCLIGYEGQFFYLFRVLVDKLNSQRFYILFPDKFNDRTSDIDNAYTKNDSDW